MRLSQGFDYTWDVGSSHILDYRLWLARHHYSLAPRWQSPRTPAQRDHDEESSGAYR